MKITIDMTGELDRIRNEATAKTAPPPKPKKRKKSKDSGVSEDLTMRLMAVGGVSDESAVQLELDTVAYIQGLLAKGNKKKAVSFLNNNKHRFTPDMKDSLTNVINEGL